MKQTLAAVALAGTLLCAGQAVAQKADVMHWWTSGGESRAVAGGQLLEQTSLAESLPQSQVALRGIHGLLFRR